MQELDEKTPALQQLRRNYDTAVRNCDQLTSQLKSTVEVSVWYECMTEQGHECMSEWDVLDTCNVHVQVWGMTE